MARKGIRFFAGCVQGEGGVAMEVLDDLSRSQKDAVAKVMEGVCEMIGEMAYSSDTTQCLAVAVALKIEESSWISIDQVIEKLKEYKENGFLKNIK